MPRVSSLHSSGGVRGRLQRVQFRIMEDSPGTGDSLPNRDFTRKRGAAGGGKLPSISDAERYFDESTEVWSWTIRQPSGNLFMSSVNSPVDSSPLLILR